MEAPLSDQQLHDVDDRLSDSFLTKLKRYAASKIFSRSGSFNKSHKRREDKDVYKKGAIIQREEHLTVPMHTAEPIHLNEIEKLSRAADNFASIRGETKPSDQARKENGYRGSSANQKTLLLRSCSMLEKTRKRNTNLNRFRNSFIHSSIEDVLEVAEIADEKKENRIDCRVCRLAATEDVVGQAGSKPVDTWPRNRQKPQNRINLERRLEEKLENSRNETQAGVDKTLLCKDVVKALLVSDEDRSKTEAPSSVVSGYQKGIYSKVQLKEEVAGLSRVNSNGSEKSDLINAFDYETRNVRQRRSADVKKLTNVVRPSPVKQQKEAVSVNVHCIKTLKNCQKNSDEICKDSSEESISSSPANFKKRSDNLDHSNAALICLNSVKKEILQSSLHFNQNKAGWRSSNFDQHSSPQSISNFDEKNGNSRKSNFDRTSVARSSSNSVAAKLVISYPTIEHASVIENPHRRKICSPLIIGKIEVISSSSNITMNNENLQEKNSDTPRLKPLEIHKTEGITTIQNDSKKECNNNQNDEQAFDTDDDVTVVWKRNTSMSASKRGELALTCKFDRSTRQAKQPVSNAKAMSGVKLQSH